MTDSRQARTIALGLVMAAVVVVGGAAWWRCRAAVAGPTDLVLITVDTLRADRVGAYGYVAARTPVIDALAAEGLRFDQSTTAFPRTTPAMASLFTGLWPHHHGSREVWDSVEHGTFLTEVLAARGYQTFGVSSNSACGGRQGFDRGFDRLVEREQLDRFDADVVTDRALRLVERADPERPLFLWVHYVDPHWPYRPPLDQLPDQPEAPLCHALMAEQSARKLTTGQIYSDHAGVASAALEDCRALYDASIGFADREIGRLFEALRARERWERSLVVFTSDHGENLGEDALFFAHGPSVNDAALRVPLIMRGPGIPAGRTDSGVARSEDVLPTLLQLLQVPRDQWPEVDGQDLSWRWDERVPRPEAPARYAFAESGTALTHGVPGFLASGREGRAYCVHEARFSLCSDPRTGRRSFHDRQTDPGLERPTDGTPAEVQAELTAALERWPLGTARQRAVRTPSFKLVERPRLDGGFGRSLYDLSADPAELHDVQQRHPTTAQDLQATLDGWIAAVSAPRQQVLDADAVQQLEALGYIDQ